MQSEQHLADRISLISVSSTARVAAEAEKLRRAGVDVVDFSVGEPDFPTPGNVKQAAFHALEQDFTRYTAIPGVEELRQAVCDRHRLDYGTRYSVPECVVTIGGKHAIFNATQALLNHGDEVIIPVPYWVTYYDVVCYAGGKPVLLETDEREGFSLTAAKVERAMTPKTRLIIINSPCNPSGAIVDPGEFEKIALSAQKHGAWLLTDECYCRFIYEGRPFSAAAVEGIKSNVVVAGSLSKTYAMTGWRIGFTLSPGPLAAAIIKLQSHSTSNPTSIAQKAAIEALNGPQESVETMLAEYRTRRAYVISRLRAMPGLSCTEPHGAFYAYPNIGGLLSPKGPRTPMEFAERLLKESHVAVVPGEAFGTEKHVRISYATSMENLQKGLDRFEAFVRGHGA